MRIRSLVLFSIIFSVYLFSCGAGLVVRRSAEWDRTDWYGKKVVVLPGLGAAGIRFSDPNPNDAVDSFLKKQLPKLPKYKPELVAYYHPVFRIFSEKGFWPEYKNMQNRFSMTGRVDTLLLQQIGEKMATEYLILPLYLSTDYTSWEFTGLFSYYSAAVEIVLFSVKEKAIVFRARARGYSIGDLEKAYNGACEEVVKVFK